MFLLLQAAIKGAVSIETTKESADVRPNWLTLATVTVGLLIALTISRDVATQESEESAMAFKVSKS